MTRRGRPPRPFAPARCSDSLELTVQQLPAKVRPDTVVVVVLPDGRENASETPQERVGELVDEYDEEGRRRQREADDP